MKAIILSLQIFFCTGAMAKGLITHNRNCIVVATSNAAHKYKLKIGDTVSFQTTTKQGQSSKTIASGLTDGPNSILMPNGRHEGDASRFTIRQGLTNTTYEFEILKSSERKFVLSLGRTNRATGKSTGALKDHEQKIAKLVCQPSKHYL
jgi:hypothetical protein